MSTKYTRLSTTTPRYGMASMPGMRSTNPMVQQLIEDAQKKREEEEREERLAAQNAAARAALDSSSFARKTSNPGTAAAMAALPAAPSVTPTSARLRSVNPDVQAALDAKYAREEEAYREWEKQREARKTAHLADLENAGGVYASLPSRADFGALSGAREDVGDPTYRFINGDEDFRNKAKWTQTGYNNDREKLRYMTDDEVQTYNYLYNKNIGNSMGKYTAMEQANAYLRELSDKLDERQAEAERKKNERFAEAHPVLSSVTSIGDNLIGGVASAVDLAAQNVRRAVTGEDVNYNTRAQQWGRTAEDVRGTVSKKIDSPVGRFLYDVGMSGADSLAAGAFGSLGGAALLGAGSGSSAARDAAARGGSDNRALIQGIAAAAAETIFEKISIGELRAMKEVPVTGARSVAKNLIKSMATNASEEAATELANVVVDTINMGGLSKYRTSVDAYLAQGMQEKDARAKAIWEIAGQIGLAAASGAVMGAAFGGIGSTQSAVENARMGAAINRAGDTQRALDEGSAQAKGTDARRLADQLAEKQRAGERLRNMEIGALARESGRQIASDRDVLGRDLPTFDASSVGTRATAAALKRAGSAMGREVRFFRDAPEVGGYSENGYVWLNVDAAEPMAAVFAHELTHTAENAAVYGELRKMALGEMDAGALASAIAQKKKTYRDFAAKTGRLETELNDEGAMAEIVADYTSKLFTDEAEIAKLAGRNRNAALRLYDRVREWAAGARGDEEKAFLAKAQRTYAQALRETKGQASGERRERIGRTQNGSLFVEVERDILDGVPQEQWAKTVKKNLEERFPNGINVNGQLIGVTDSSRRELAHSKSAKWGSKKRRGDRYRATDNLDEILEAAQNWIGEEKNHERNDDLEEFARAKVLLRIGNNNYNADIVVGTDSNGNARVHDISNVERTEFEDEKAPRKSQNLVAGGTSKRTQGFDISIDDQNENVNSQQNSVTEMSQSGRQWSISENKLETNAIWADEPDEAVETADESNETIETAEESNETVSSSNAEHVTYDGGTIRVMGKPSKEELGQLYRYVARYGGDIDLIMGEKDEVDGETAERVTEEYSAMGPAANADEVLRRVRGHYGIREKIGAAGAAEGTETPEPIGESRVGVDEDYWRAVGEAADAAAPAEEGGSVTPGYLAEMLRREEETFAHERERLLGERDALRMRGAEKKAFAGETDEGGIRRANLSVKAETVFDRGIKRAARAMEDALGVSWMADKTEFQAAAQRLAELYLAAGEYAGTQEARTQKTLDAFEALWYATEEENRKCFEDYGKLFDGFTLRFGSEAAEKTYREKLVPKYGDLMQFGEGGVGVGEAYAALRERAPALFPEYYRTEDAQLKRMEGVAASLTHLKRRQEKLENPREYAEAVKRAKVEFSAAVRDALQAAELVRRYAADEKSAAEAVEETPTDPTDLVKIAHDVNRVQKELEKVRDKYLMTGEDRRTVDRLLRGELRPEEVRSINREAIMAVYQKKLELERVREPIERYNKRRKAQLHGQVDDVLGSLDNIKDKRTGLAYSVNTMERNVHDVFLDRSVAEQINAGFFNPVHASTAEMTRAKNAYVKRVKELGIAQKAANGNRDSEAYAVQFMGEAADNIAQLEQKLSQYKNSDVITAHTEEEVLNGRTLKEWKDAVDEFKAANSSMNWAKIDRAVGEFRAIYNELFEQMNLVRVRNGYAPIDYRRGYFPHFRNNTPDGVFGRIMAGLGVTADVTPLPTSINGMTETFKPGINYMGAAKQRKGFETDYDAIEGFDRYLNGALRMIYHTDNIQRLRALERRIRYATTDEGMRERIDRRWRELEADESKTDEEKLEAMQSLYSEGRFTLSNFCLELTEYTNILAGKRSKHDRFVENLFGRNVYNFFNAINRRVGANMVAANIGSAMTNFIPMQQGYAQLGGVRIMRGMWSTIGAMRRGDDFAARSDFLANRRGTETLGSGMIDWLSEKAGWAMQTVDNLTAETLVRARYEQNTARGLSAEESMAEADRWAASVMGDRSLGAMPTIFHATNPLFKFFTQFQLEVANNAAYITKDLPRDAEGTGKLVKLLAKYFLSAFIFNELYEVLFGRRPALDPISWANELTGDITGDELPNLFEIGVGAVTGDLDMDDFRSERVGIGDAALRLFVNAAEQVPFVSGVLPVFFEDADPRLPITSAIPNIPNVVNAFDEGRAWQDRTEMLYKELSKPLYYIGMPLGGGQLKKAIEGVAAVLRGGSYSYNSQGERTLQYAIPSDNAGEWAGNLLRAALFGKSSFGTAQDWVDSEFDSFSAKETAVYRGLLDVGVGEREAYAAMQTINGAKGTDDESREVQKRRLLREMQLSDDAKAVIYTGMMATETEIALLQAFSDENFRTAGAAMVLCDMRDAAGTTAKRKVLEAADMLSDVEKVMIYREKISKAWDEEIAAAHQAGFSFAEFLAAQNALAEIEARQITEEPETQEEDRFTAASSIFDGSVTQKEEKTAWEIRREKEDEEARKLERDNAFIDWAIGEGYSLNQRFVLMDCLGVSTQAKKESGRKKYGPSLPKLPEFSIPQIKLPELPQIKLPSFGG